MGNITFIRYECNEKLIIQSTDFLLHSAIHNFLLQIKADLSFESLHGGTKCSINNLSTNIIDTLTLFRMRGGSGGGRDAHLPSFLFVTSTNVRNRPLKFLTFSFNTFATLL